MVDAVEVIRNVQSISRGEYSGDVKAVMSDLYAVIFSKESLSDQGGDILNSDQIDYVSYLRNALSSVEEDREDVLMGWAHDFGFIVDQNIFSPEKNLVSKRLVSAFSEAANALHKQKKLKDFSVTLVAAVRFATTPQALEAGLDLLQRSIARALRNDTLTYGYCLTYCQLVAGVHNLKCLNAIDNSRMIDRVLLKAEDNFEAMVLALLDHEDYETVNILLETFSFGSLESNPFYKKAKDLKELALRFYAKNGVEYRDMGDIVARDGEFYAGMFKYLHGHRNEDPLFDPKIY